MNFREKMDEKNHENSPCGEQKGCFYEFSRVREVLQIYHFEFLSQVTDVASSDSKL